jgi:hypothetical protein
MGDNDDPDQEQEWLRESDLSNGGLILIGVYMVLVNRRELSQHRSTRSRLVVWARAMAQNLALVARWPGSGTSGGSPGGMLSGGLMAVSVQAAGYLGLRPDRTPTAR